MEKVFMRHQQDSYDVKNRINDFIKAEKEDAQNLSELNVLYKDAEKEEKHPKHGASFEENKKSIDFMLVYENEISHSHISPKRKPIEEQKNIRKCFELNLRAQGLELEKEIIGELTFIKIHTPRTVLRKYCEILKLKMPVTMANSFNNKRSDFNVISEVKSVCKKFIKFFVTIDPHDQRGGHPTMYAEYNSSRSYLFDDDNPKFFTSTNRILIVNFILNHTHWSPDESDVDSVGIQSLLGQNIYKAAYPLHDGGYYEEGTFRNELRVEWASLDKWIRLQPMNDIKEYLGVKNAFYFAWLGFYTQNLIYASVLGIAVFVYGFLFISQDHFSPFICDHGEEIVMCPLCDKSCDYWRLNDTCLYARITHLFSNNFTVVFAFLMSVWATLFLEMWKRYSSVLTHSWGLSDYSSQCEHPRPQYLAKLGKAKITKINSETNQKEPILSFWFYKLPTVIFSYTLVLFFIFIVFQVVLSIALFRMWMQYLGAGTTDSFWDKYLFIPVSSGVLNLISILVLNVIYQNVAHYLTTLELPRTQTDFENSLSIKLYVFQFVNYYASIIYIAFLKGKFVGYPSHFIRVFGFRQEECHAGGCLIELSIQLAIIMVGQQFLNSILEIIVPAGWNHYNKYQLRRKEFSSLNDVKNNDPTLKRWCEDYKLSDWGSEGLFNEYLEIVMQFGFVTLFASAFPLAPLFALINNIFELRLDAQKILKYYRRPVPYQVPNIGVWYRITDVIGKMAVLFNGAIIAFSSDFIPKIIYFIEGSKNEFGEFLLSRFSTGDFPEESKPIFPSFNTSQCWYYGYRESPDSPNKYELTMVFWKILAARLIFILLFQNAVFVIKTAAQWLIPDVPLIVEERKKMEARLLTEFVISREAEKVAKDAEYNYAERRTSQQNCESDDEHQVEIEFDDLL